jgi:hypothetical protein
VLGLRDGGALKLDAGRLSLLGDYSTKLFLSGNIRELTPQDPLQFLLSA